MKIVDEKNYLEVVANTGFIPRVTKDLEHSDYRTIFSTAPQMSSHIANSSSHPDNLSQLLSVS